MTDSGTKTTAAPSFEASPRERMTVFAMTGAAGTPGGIASANLNILKVLQTLSNESRGRLRIVSLHETRSDRPDFLDANVEFLGCAGNKWVFACKLLTSFRLRCIYVFDHVRLALPIIPLIILGFRDFVIFSHGSESWKRVRLSSKWLLRRAKLCLTNSRFTLRSMQRTLVGFEGSSCLLGLPENHSETATRDSRYNATLTLTAADGTIRKLNERVILLVARIDSGEREKGHRELLRVWKDVLRDYPAAQLVFAGPGNDRASLTTIATDEGIASTVFIPGFLPIDTLKELYRCCYAFVMPSRQEGFGLVYLEAMNASKPCIGCLDGGCEEIIQDGKSGILLQSRFEDRQLLEALRRLLGDAQLARQMGENGSRRLQEFFSATHARERLRKALEELFR